MRNIELLRKGIWSLVLRTDDKDFRSLYVVHGFDPSKPDGSQWDYSYFFGSSAYGGMMDIVAATACLLQKAGESCISVHKVLLSGCVVLGLCGTDAGLEDSDGNALSVGDVVAVWDDDALSPLSLEYVAQDVESGQSFITGIKSRIHGTSLHDSPYGHGQKIIKAKGYEETADGERWGSMNATTYFVDTDGKKKYFAKQLWDSLEDVPMDPETEELETDWMAFPAGTHREDIWRWFEETFDVSVGRDLMGCGMD